MDTEGAGVWRGREGDWERGEWQWKRQQRDKGECGRDRRHAPVLQAVGKASEGGSAKGRGRVGGSSSRSPRSSALNASVSQSCAQHRA